MGLRGSLSGNVDWKLVKGLPGCHEQSLAVTAAEGEVGDQILGHRDASEKLALRRDDIDGGSHFQRLAGIAARLVDAGRHPKIALRIELQAIAAAALAEVVDQP